MRLIYLLFFSLLSGCSIFKKTEATTLPVALNPTTTELKTTQDEYSPRVQGIYHASREKRFELIHTRLDVRFDWQNATLLGVATLTLSPKFYPQDTLYLDAKGMSIEYVISKNQILSFNYNGETLAIPLERTYLKSDTLTLSVKYIARPDLRPRGGSQAIAGDKGLYFINPKGDNPSKMPQIWTQGETESNSVWFPTIDAPNQKMAQDLFITVDQRYTTLSNGRLVSSTTVDNKLRIDHWQQILPHAPYLTMLGVGEFAVVKDTWKRSDGTTIPVHYYVEPAWENHARNIFGNTPEMLSYFSKLTGFEYPWDKYHQLIVRDYVSGAMENTGAVIFGDMLYSTAGDLVDQNWDDIIAHELSHHWFGDLVTCESWSNLPMNESFATYFEVLWDEYKNGKDAAAYHLQGDKQTYFRTTKNQSDHHNLIWFDYDDKEQMFDGHSYSKGACILHQLRQVIGDEAFFAGIKHYLHQNQFGTVEAHDLRMAFESVTGIDLNWFFNQWFFAKGHPTLEVKHEVKNDSLFVFIKQKQDLNEFPLYCLPGSIRIWDAAGSHDYAINVANEFEVKAFPISGTLLNWVIDPEQNWLVSWQVKKPDAFLAHQLNHASHYVLRKEALQILAERDAQKYASLILESMNDSFFDVRLEAIYQSNRIKKTADIALLDLLKNKAVHDEHPQVRLAALTFLHDHFPKNSDLLKLAHKTITRDASNLCKAKALSILGNLNTSLAFEHVELWQNDQSSTLRTATLAFYAEHGDTNHLNQFQKAMQSTFLQGQDRMAAMLHLNAYLTRIKNPEIRSSGLLLLKNFYDAETHERLVYEYVLGRMIFQLSEELKALDEEIAAYEAAKDFVWVQRLQKERNLLIDVIKKFGE
jgi:aminopeptidase N